MLISIKHFLTWCNNNALWSFMYLITSSSSLCGKAKHSRLILIYRLRFNNVRRKVEENKNSWFCTLCLWGCEATRVNKIFLQSKKYNRIRNHNLQWAVSVSCTEDFILFYFLNTLTQNCKQKAFYLFSLSTANTVSVYAGILILSSHPHCSVVIY